MPRKSTVGLFLLSLVLIVVGLSLSWRLIIELIGLLVFLAGLGILVYTLRRIMK